MNTIGAKIPLPHQVTAIEFLASRYHAVCGDDPGLGKTDTALWAARRVGARTVLVICPASVRTQWRAAISDHHFLPDYCDVISYNEATMPRHARLLKAGYDVCIADEAHFLKNLESQRTAAVLGRNGLMRRAARRWLLSGTLAPNYRPIELWPMLKTLHPDFALWSLEKYAQRYCGAYWDGHQVNMKGATRVDELSAALRSFMIRRTEREVYPTRVQPFTIKVPVEISREARQQLRDAELEMASRERAVSSTYDSFSQLGDVATLRRIVGEAKTGAVAEFVADLLSSVDKVVVFAHHRAVCAKLAAALARFSPVLYVGGLPAAEKDAVKARFMTDPATRLFIGQDDTAGTGVDGLQKVASHVVFAEPSWVPGDTEQRIRRLARIGQKDPVVKAYFVVAHGTLDDAVVGAHDRKERVGENLLPK